MLKICTRCKRRYAVNARKMVSACCDVLLAVAPIQYHRDTWDNRAG